MVKLQFNETTYEFIRHNDGSTTPSTKELHIYKDGELVHKQHMHVDMFTTGYLTLTECVNLINKL
jgi:hypothetical protein